MGGVIVQRQPESGYGLAKRGFADHRVTPHGIHQLIPRHESVAVRNKVQEQLEDYRFEVNLLPLPAKPPCFRIDQEVIETVNRMLAHGLPACRTAHQFRREGTPVIEYSTTSAAEQHAGVAQTRPWITPDTVPSENCQTLVKPPGGTPYTLIAWFDNPRGLWIRPLFN